MSLAYADAVAALYRSSQEQFVSERKRLSAELKAAGDKAGAAQLGKLGRASLSAWAVNQLWWQARERFEELLAAAERLRQGELAASASHREALAALRNRASSLLADAGHAVNDATLRRVTTTLSALAATGSFEPDLPGALSADRDPPGFDALGAFGSSAVSPARSAPPSAPPAAEQAKTEQAEARRQAEERQREKEEATRREEAERQAQRERREAERRKLAAALELARGELAVRRALVERLDAELGVARRAQEKSRDAILELEQQLARLGPGQS